MCCRRNCWRPCSDDRLAFHGWASDSFHLFSAPGVGRRPRQIRNRIALAGHSYGERVIKASGTDDWVVALVYIAVLRPTRTRPPKASRKVSRHRRFRPRPSRGRASVDVRRRRRVLRRRLIGAGKDSCLDNSLSTFLRKLLLCERVRSRCSIDSLRSNETGKTVGRE
jgi:hypothetical protein